ncbi:MAG: type II toxin-antitoxin system RelE/ParE family toxin [Bacteroidetes bacterium]|nr:type II toxin-antitoxin system RelE/ParE family toxin [Bacteroidota bacterium]
MGTKKETIAKSYKVEISATAIRNIEEITGFIAFINHQPMNAIKVGDAIFKTIDKIALNPYVFRECLEIPTKNHIYRKAVCLSWIIIYKIKGEVIHILGIIHASRKPTKIKKYKNPQF